MGCDIHLFVERRERAGAPWQTVPVKTTCSWCDGKGVGRDEKECYGCKGTKLEAGYDHRNYNTFAILADVRNGRGFAGIKTGEGFNPISGPRGLPDDLSETLAAVRDDDSYDDEKRDALKREHGARWLGDHSYSWLTLAELDACDWRQRTTLCGVVSPSEFREFLEKGKPSSWCGDVSGSLVLHISNDEMRAHVTGDRVTKGAWQGKSLYTRVSWGISYAEASGAFHSKFLPALREAASTGPDNLRIVFGFDS